MTQVMEQCALGKNSKLTLRLTRRPTTSANENSEIFKYHYVRILHSGRKFKVNDDEPPTIWLSDSSSRNSLRGYYPLLKNGRV